MAGRPAISADRAWIAWPQYDEADNYARRGKIADHFFGELRHDLDLRARLDLHPSADERSFFARDDSTGNVHRIDFVSGATEARSQLANPGVAHAWTVDQDRARAWAVTQFLTLDPARVVDVHPYGWGGRILAAGDMAFAWGSELAYYPVRRIAPQRLTYVHALPR